MEKIELFLKDYNFINKTIFVTGATGCIGQSLMKYLYRLKANIIVGYRDSNKFDILKKRYSNIEGIYIDMSNVESILNCVNELKKLSIDVFILNNGYSNNKLEYVENNIEKHFMINCYSIYIFIKNMINTHINSQYILTGSISYKNIKTNTKTIYNDNIDDYYKLYDHSKRVMLQLMYIFNIKHNINISFTHPGIVSTPLFENRNNRGIKRIFLPIIRPFMNNTDISSLTMIYAIDKNIDNEHWIGPKGVFNVFGLPGVSKLKSNLLNKKELDFIQKEVNKIDEMIENKYQLFKYYCEGD